MDIRLFRRRQLRATQTEAEALLWRFPRHRSFLRFKFRRQHSVGPYVVDFFCPRVQLAIELDGGQHFEATTQAYDGERTEYLARRRITVVRFPNDQVLFQTEAVLEEIA